MHELSAATRLCARRSMSTPAWSHRPTRLRRARPRLAADEQDAIAREQAVANAATAVDVSAAANVARSKSLDDREAELAKREQEHAAKVKANEDRIAQVRASLSA